MKNKMQQEFMHVPLYGWLAGGVALILSILYFRGHKPAVSTGTTASAQPSNYPQNIYESTNVYSQPGSVPGATASSGPPTPPFAGPSWSFNTPADRSKPFWWRWVPTFAQKWGLSSEAQWGTGPTGVPKGADATYSWQSLDTGSVLPVSTGAPIGGRGGGAALMPAPVNPRNWSPIMNSDIFGTNVGQQTPQPPAMTWPMQPAPMYQ